MFFYFSKWTRISSRRASINSAGSCSPRVLISIISNKELSERQRMSFPFSLSAPFAAFSAWSSAPNLEMIMATFLKAFSAELKKYIEERNLRNRVFFHVSDEPNMSMIFSYKKAAAYIRTLFEGYTVMDALSDYRFYKKGIVTNPIPSNDHIEKFLGNVENLWVHRITTM